MSTGQLPFGVRRALKWTPYVAYIPRYQPVIHEHSRNWGNSRHLRFVPPPESLWLDP